MDSLKLTGTFKNTMFQGTNDFAILAFEPTGETGERVIVNQKYGTFSVKGTFPSLKEGEEYEMNVGIENSSKYGISYTLQFIKPNRAIDFADRKSFQSFLETIVSEKIAKGIVDTLENPKEVLETGNLIELVKVKGVGETTAQKIFDNYEMHKDYSKAYIELGKHDIDIKTIGKVVKYFKSVDKAIEMILTNPYAMTVIGGYGFKRCDEIFLRVNPTDFHSPVRIMAYIKHTMDTEATKGNTWMGLEDMINHVHTNIGVDRHAVAKTLGEMIKDGNYIVLTHKDTKPRIGHKRYHELEHDVAKNLMRILTYKNTFSAEGLLEAIQKEEDRQGWDFTGQQKHAIETISKFKVIMLEGLAGSGKSTSLKVLLDYYAKINYTYAQTALSGKASSNLALITGKEGSTIHRLLGIDFESGGFVFNEKNKLPYDIIIVDEISMVDMTIFYSLLVAMKDTAKLILVGDSEQLEAIGVPVMKPLIDSGIIPRIMLTEIHRQAKKSAIVTHSIDVRSGVVPLESRALGVSTHGEMQDLTYNIVASDSEIAQEVSFAFHKKIRDGVDIMDIQIISPMRGVGEASCERINNLCQRIYNGDESKPSHEVKLSKDQSYILRQGDKVINIKNNYGSRTKEGRVKPVFNGNIGIVKGFELWYDDETGKRHNVMVVDFEGLGEIIFFEREYNTIELAYCITIHKSQGMGVSHVIVAYPFAYTLASRQSLYTAITRAKHDCLIVVEYKTLKYAVNKDATKKKKTYLSEFLRQLRDIIVADRNKQKVR